MDSAPSITTTLVSPLPPALSSEDSPSTPSHHVGSPPTSFQNPWPSFVKKSLWEIFQTRFSRNRNFVPVPPRNELVAFRTPDWGSGKTGLKATWIGHASFLVETATSEGRSRGIRILFDPLWSERTSPVKWIGPKRYTPTPCTLQEIPDVDLVVISHNHYDHLDVDTIRHLHQARKDQIHYFCALGGAPFFLSLGIHRDQVTELDWWQGVRVDVPDAGSLNLTCTPSQHISGRTPFDSGSTLWCSWVVEEQSSPIATKEEPDANGYSSEHKTDIVALNGSSSISRKLFFAGDTGYRAVSSSDTSESESSLPVCPAFSEIGDRFGPFDLALLPIGLYAPRSVLSSVHCSPEDSISVHFDIKSKKSIGMHWGTVRGGISGYYEDVRDPPRRWKEAAQKNGLVWGEQVGLLDIGETLVLT
ncbi:hypothetical protein MMC13_002202 [Lambiella insularis]|nr:hypothetical protein [Lambiella insularis]